MLPGHHAPSVHLDRGRVQFLDGQVQRTGGGLSPMGERCRSDRALDGGQGHAAVDAPAAGQGDRLRSEVDERRIRQTVKPASVAVATESGEANEY